MLTLVLKGIFSLMASFILVATTPIDRICAAPGTRASGAISAAVHYYCDPEQLFRVSAGSFLPAPKVDSAVIRLNIRKEPPIKAADEKAFFKIVRASFLQRRKTLSNSLSAGLSMPKSAVIEMLNAAKIPLNARAEEMTMQQFADITNASLALR